MSKKNSENDIKKGESDESTRAKEEKKSRFDISANEFRKILEWFGYTQSKFAEKAELKPQTISRYLQGLHIPVSWIKKLIEIIGDEEYDYILEKVRKGEKFKKPLHHRKE